MSPGYNKWTEGGLRSPVGDAGDCPYLLASRGKAGPLRKESLNTVRLHCFSSSFQLFLCHPSGSSGTQQHHGNS